ncbi:Slp family lipoprotein [Oleiagrimonas sp.]|jgi:outer membrane lipoprotein|uniref:Slp family lipoprotein n=1 Tax=Oleiagrimonas sp. TaxID=2010330 RepID=UPI002601B63A|nr:Slp family lipoprotein [Oleiagrimonas sp.]MDA3912663.1 Slp family lipoprotein [Oleiagrimonas sp.]
MPRWKLALVTLSALGLGACATIPKPLTGSFAAVTPQTASGGAANTAHVRWGGQIIKTEPADGQTCFYMLAYPLNDLARPQTGQSSMGRFVACHSGFYDPEIFTKGREVTFTGTLHGIITHKVGTYDYPYPRVDASTVYLWPKRPLYVSYPGPYYSPFYDPFWGPPGYWGGYWGPYYRPYGYYPEPIIVAPRQRLSAPAARKMSGGK